MCKHCFDDMPCPDCLFAGLVLAIEEEAVALETDADRAADAWYAELLRGDSADRGV